MVTICIARRTQRFLVDPVRMRTMWERCPDCRGSGWIKDARGFPHPCLRCRPDLWKKPR